VLLRLTPLFPSCAGLFRAVFLLFHKMAIGENTTPCGASPFLMYFAELIMGPQCGPFLGKLFSHVLHGMGGMLIIVLLASPPPFLLVRNTPLSSSGRVDPPRD